MAIKITRLKIGVESDALNAMPGLSPLKIPSIRLIYIIQQKDVPGTDKYLI